MAAEKTAEALAFAEKGSTACEVEIVERRKRVAVIAAQQDAKTEAAGVTVAAEAERDAADNRAETIRTIAAASVKAAKIEAAGIRERGS